MASSIRVTLNHSGMGALLKSSEVRAELHRLAAPVLAAVIADPHDDTHDYENSAHIEDVTTDRAVVRVVVDDWKAFIMEANYGVLARALDAAR